LLAQQSVHPEDQIDAAHRGLYQKKQDAKKTASSVTEQIASARVAVSRTREHRCPRKLHRRSHIRADEKG
jgi:hypothetical protein